MKCICPKCHAHVELDLPEVTEEGASAQCPECKSRFSVSRESFGGRALRKTGDITCAACGDELGPHLHCTGCGVLFPDYLVAAVGRKKKRAVQKVSLSISVFPERKRAAINLPRIDTAAPQAARPQAAQKAGAPRNRVTQAAVAALLLVAVGVGGGFFYKSHQAANEFSNNVVLEIYFTRLGEKKSIDACNRIAAEWRSKGDTVPGSAPRPTPNEVRDLENIRAKVDGLTGKIPRENAPKNLVPSLDRLDRLRAAYMKAHQLAMSPTGNTSSYAAASQAADNEYRAAAHDLTAGLPKKVVSSIRVASQRYKGLQGFLEL